MGELVSVEANIVFETKAIKPGDVFIIRVPRNIDDNQKKILQELTQSVCNLVPNITAMMLYEDIKVETLSEEKMREAGWVRENA